MLSLSDLPLAKEDAIPAISLRLYQQLCIERVLDAYRARPKGGKALVVLPVGTGKTIVFAEVARRLHLNTLVIANSPELLKQAAEKFYLVNPDAIIGQVGDGRHEYGRPITVASIQTLSRPEHLKMLQLYDYSLVIIDECHHSAARSYQMVLQALSGAFILGLTATPDRSDKQSIEVIFGEPVYSASILDMVVQGYLCDLRAFALRTTTSLDDVTLEDDDFKLNELEAVIDSPERNKAVVAGYLTYARGRQGLCFAGSVEHAIHLAETFNAMGIRAAAISGDPSKKEERKRILHDYERGKIAVVCNYGVLIEGYDAPQTSCVIMARPTKSRSLYVQCIGRGTRLAPGKQDCIIIDVTDNCLKHRLEPLALHKTLELDLHEGESVREAQERTRCEKAERDPQEERTVSITQRGRDLSVNILARMDWRRKSSGAYVLEVGEKKHRIMLLPSQEKDGYYSVWAQLAPDFKRQQWLKESRLAWAQQHAEMKARLLQDERKRVLVDNNAVWRIQPASLKQLYTLRKYNIPFSAEITAGEASDLIGHAIAEREKRQAEEKTKKGTTGQRKRVRRAGV